MAASTPRLPSRSPHLTARAGVRVDGLARLPDSGHDRTITVQAGYMRVTLQPQGRTFDVAANESILDAALRARLALPHGCRGGNCGSCRAQLVAGEVDYPRGPPLGLTPAEAAGGSVLLCRARPLTDVVVEAREIRRVADVEVKTLPCRVERVTAPAPDVRCVWLRLPAVEELAFRAGQYVDVLLPGGARRSYSIASPPHAATLELHVGRKPGGQFSGLVFESLQRGALLRIEGPLGEFAYADEPDATEPLVLVGGGTGFAPLKAILRHVLESGSQRPLRLYWGARTAADLYEHAWLQERVARFPQLAYVPVLSAADAPAAAFRTGFVHEAFAADVRARVVAESDVYAAGPPAMIAALRGVLADVGWSSERLRCDAFD